MSNGHGGQFVTLFEAKELMTEMLKDYEREIVEPRHRETQRDLAEIKGIMQGGKGAVYFGGILSGCAGIFWIVVQIVHALGAK